MTFAKTILSEDDNLEIGILEHFLSSFNFVTQTIGNEVDHESGQGQSVQRINLVFSIWSKEKTTPKFNFREQRSPPLAHRLLMK